MHIWRQKEKSHLSFFCSHACKNTHTRTHARHEYTQTCIHAHTHPLYHSPWSVLHQESKQKKMQNFTQKLKRGRSICCWWWSRHHRCRRRRCCCRRCCRRHCCCSSTWYHSKWKPWPLKCCRLAKMVPGLSTKSPLRWGRCFIGASLQ